MKIVRTFSVIFMCITIASCNLDSKRDVPKRVSYPLISKFSMSEVHAMAGTGFFILYKGKYYLVTAWHVLSGKHPINTGKLIQETMTPKFIRIDDYKEKYVYGKVYPLLTDHKHFIEAKTVDSGMYDIALLHIPNDDIISKKFPVLTIDESLLEEDIKKNTKIYYWGFPSKGRSDRDPELFEGILLEDLIGDKTTIITNVLSEEGCSGSPVFEKVESQLIPIGIIGGHDNLLNATYITPFSKGLKSLDL